MDEIWKPIPGYEGYYEASSCGRIRSVERYTRNRWGGYTHRKAQLMKCRIVANGYAHVKLTKNGQSAEPLVHRLIADSFLPNPTDLPQVNHIDGNKTNNAVSNLERCTESDNQLHSRRILKRICGKKHKPVICLETGICYETAHHAARDMELNPAGIYYVCEGKNKHTHGLHFSYI